VPLLRPVDLMLYSPDGQILNRNSRVEFLSIGTACRNWGPSIWRRTLPAVVFESEQPGRIPQ